MVDPVQASKDFANQRGGVPLSENPYTPLAPASASSGTPATSSSTEPEDAAVPSSIMDTLNKLAGYLPAMLAVLAVNAVALVALSIVVIIFIVKRSGTGKRGRRGLATAVPLGRRGSRAPSPYPHAYEPVDTQGADDVPFTTSRPVDSEDAQFTPPMPAFHADGSTSRPVAPGLRPHSMMTTSSMGGIPRAYRASAASDATAFMPPSPGFLQADNGKWPTESRPKSIA